VAKNHPKVVKIIMISAIIHEFFVHLDFGKQCLREVLEIVLKNIKSKTAILECLSGYAKNDEQPFCDWNIPWPELKSFLHLTGRNDIINLLQETTLLTRGIYVIRNTTAMKLR